ncbi:PQQ-binding-like beta-propeller repeat protein [Limibacillus halophilus]|uniref:Outer membrane protein assembly factor BamB n=1 Tax=Limibacillus halophilus TaxID=1579333 RepID=A0A839SSE0_9PROT|nr:PQQ-binding-like beta-propeller repeat protein [Limibacillus halophilus]MBB3064630.1 outer membrane protein assembly factor BamB [Limibacillus halophilus]
MKFRSAVHSLKLSCLVLVGLLFLGGCSLYDDYIGDAESDPPLPGTREPVYNLDQALRADPSVADLPVTLPAPQANAEWAQAGGRPDHAMYHLDLGTGLRLAWTADVGEGSGSNVRILAQPVVAEGRIFTLDATSKVSAFDANSGRRFWQRDIAPEDEDDGFFGGGLAYQSGRLYVTTGFAQVLALDSSSGEVIWRQQFATPLRAAPTVVGNQVYVVTIDNQTYALSAGDGSQVWVHRGIQEAAGLLGAASPAVTNDLVVTPYSSGELYALRPDNGHVLWSDSLSGFKRSDPILDLADIRGHPVIDRDFVLVMGNSNRSVAIAALQGQRAWDIEAGGISTPWTAGDFVFLVTNEQTVMAVVRSSGRVRWVTQLPRFEDPEDRDGPIAWYGPIVAGNQVIVAGSNGEVRILAPSDGAENGVIKLRGKVTIAPLVANRTLYLLTEDGDLLAYR